MYGNSKGKVVQNVEGKPQNYMLIVVTTQKAELCWQSLRRLYGTSLI